MIVVHVSVRVKPDALDAFLKATLENAAASLKEPGVARFDVLQDKTDHTHFVLNEVYRNAEAPAQHKATAHYLKWRESVAEMMAEPRSSVQFTNLFPTDEAF